MSPNYEAVSRPAGEYYDHYHKGKVAEVGAAAAIRQATLYSAPGVSVHDPHGIMCPTDETTRKMWHQFLIKAYPLTTTTTECEGAIDLPSGEFDYDEYGVRRNILHHSRNNTSYPYVFPGWIQRQCREYGGEETANINILAYLVEWCSFYYRRTNSKGNFKYSIKDVSNSNKKPLTPSQTEPAWKYCVQYAVRNMPTIKTVIYDPTVNSGPIMEHATVAINSGTYDDKIFNGAWTDEDSNDLIMSTPNCAALNAYKVQVGEGATTEKESQEDESKPVGKVKSRVITPERVRVFGNYNPAIRALEWGEESSEEEVGASCDLPEEVEDDTMPEGVKTILEDMGYLDSVPWYCWLFLFCLTPVVPLILLWLFAAVFGIFH
jgi:hypothetical protein